MNSLAFGMHKLAFALWLSLPVVCGSQIWEYLHLKVPLESEETAWSKELATLIEGEAEAPVAGGRVDVLTAQYAVEVERAGKWHQGIGQALHYAGETGRRPVLAVIAPTRTLRELSPRDLRQLDLIEKNCRTQEIRFMVLLGGAAKNGVVKKIRRNPDTRYWLSATGKLHGFGCRYFGTTKGRYTKKREGVPCKICNP